MKLISGVVVVLNLGLVLGQLTFRQDPLTNSFSLQTPSLKQSFTRYFGSRNPTAATPLNQDTAFSQQQPSFAPAPTQSQQFFGRNTFEGFQSTPQEQQLAQYYSTQQAFPGSQQFQQLQDQPQTNNQQFTPQDFSAFYQQQQQFQPQYSQYINNPTAAPPQRSTNQDQFTQQTQDQPQFQQAQAQAQRIAYSPANEVSNVKFSSQGLNYNF